MTLHLADHIVFVLLAAVFPVWDFFALRKRAALINAGRTELRIKLFQKIIWQEWIMAVALLALWFALGRTGSEIGLVPQGGALVWAGYGLTVLICTLLVLQARSIVGSPKKRAETLKQMGSVSFLLPHTKRESRSFDVVSVTAGVCEEIVYRGFLIGYLMALLSAPFWVAGLISSVVFGLAHSYQGLSGIPRTGAVGAAMALLYGLTGSLWAPMVAHAVMDLVSGRIAYAASKETGPDRSSPQVAA